MGGGATAQVEIFGSGLSGLESSLQAILTVFYPEMEHFSQFVT